jgi:hypothetical protein
MEKLKAINEWDGGGLHSNTDPGANLPPDCGMLVQLKGTEYTQVAPATKAQMECSPKFIGSVTGPVVDAAKLDANRVSQVAQSFPTLRRHAELNKGGRRETGGRPCRFCCRRLEARRHLGHRLEPVFASGFRGLPSAFRIEGGRSWVQGNIRADRVLQC